jgi:hypothetical protein
MLIKGGNCADVFDSMNNKIFRVLLESDNYWLGVMEKVSESKYIITIEIKENK